MNDQAERHPRRLPPARRGRAQDGSRDDLILAAALDLLAEKGYHGLTMTDVTARAGVSTATLYRRWTAKADLVADAIATLSPFASPHYPGTSLRDDLLALMEQAGDCDERPAIVTVAIEMARSHPDLHQTLSARFRTFIRSELEKLASQGAYAERASLSAGEFDALNDTVVALLVYYSKPSGAGIPQDRLTGLVDHVLMVLITGARTAG